MPKKKKKKKYGVIISDFPWSYEHAPPQGAADDQYELMSDEAILALCPWIDSISADDAVHLMWATWPRLALALQVMEACGFAQLTGCPWIKTVPSAGTIRIRRGIGYWFQSVSEVMIVGVRGKGGLQNGQTAKLGLLSGDERAFYGALGKHSAKPYDFHQYAEEHLKGPFAELFARREYPGWDCLGNELGWFLTPDGPKKIKPVVRDRKKSRKKKKEQTQTHPERGFGFK